MRAIIRSLTVVATASVLVAGLLPRVVAQVPADQPISSCSFAGYGDADATYPVGSWAGQYASDRTSPGTDVDPHAQQVKKQGSYGIHSRLTVRALVIRDCEGNTAALVKNDHYLAQDAIQRRIGQLLAEADSSVTYENMLTAATHNHSSPYPVTPSWGVWAFQDAFSPRAFEFFARRSAEAILEAEANLVPARMGATEVANDIFHANIPGPQGTHDGTPGGMPRSFADHEVAIMRFDDAATGEPIGTWVNYGQHPESLEDHDLITADFLAPLERMVGRETGAEMVFSQGDVGSSEGPYDGWGGVPRWMPDGTRRAWAHMGFAQMERGARYLADSIVEGFNDIGAGGGTVPYTTDFEVGSYNGWIPFPMSHPYPSVGNCRTEESVEGNPGAPAAGLPDCQRMEGGDDNIWDNSGVEDPNDMIWENLKEHGIPLPENYDAPSFTGVEENMRLRLQAVRVGEVVIGSCSCEARVDLILNFESRADNEEGNIWDGYEWDCTPAGEPFNPEAETQSQEDRQWTCNGGNYTFSDFDYARMLAQIHNDAAGWDDPDYVPYANSEPAELELIKGNFTKEELDGETGFELAVGVGHAGDYTGYTVSYREYMERDEYRKALTCCGPHSADYMVTNLVHMAQALKGGPDPVAENQYYQAQAADEARQVAFTTALGQSTGASYDAWYAALPADANPGQVLQEPEDIARYNAATFSWTGGSNVVDNPTVVVERKQGDDWVPFADQSGEVQLFLDMPDDADGVQGVVETYAQQREWHWTANFEAFSPGPRPDVTPQTPEGTYRFVVDGTYRRAPEGPDDAAAIDARNVAYELTSEPFEVSRWKGIKVLDLRVAPGGVSFELQGEPAHPAQSAGGPADPEIYYPRTYQPHPVIRWIRDDGGADVCKTCNFRPWARGANVATATLTVERADSCGTEQVTAERRDGRWFASVELFQGDRAFVAPGGVVDENGETNGLRSPSVVTGSTPRPTPCPTPTETTEPTPTPTVTETTEPTPTPTETRPGGGRPTATPSGRPTETPPRGPKRTTMSFTEANSETGQYSDGATFEARLIDEDGVPVEHAPVVFELRGAQGTERIQAVTDAAGLARARVGTLGRPGSYVLTASFGGSESRGAAADITSFVVQKEHSEMRLSSPRRLRARLTDADDADAGVADARIRFFVRGEFLAQAMTNDRGIARVRLPRRAGTFKAVFAGNKLFSASRDRLRKRAR